MNYTSIVYRWPPEGINAPWNRALWFVVISVNQINKFVPSRPSHVVVDSLFADVLKGYNFIFIERGQYPQQPFVKLEKV